MLSKEVRRLPDSTMPGTFAVAAEAVIAAGIERELLGYTLASKQSMISFRLHQANSRLTGNAEHHIILGVKRNGGSASEPISDPVGRNIPDIAGVAGEGTVVKHFV